MRKTKIVWNDNWLINNVMTKLSYKELTDLYNKTFNTSWSSAAVKHHCANDLGIKKPRINCKRHTPEQIDFLKENYSNHGTRELMEMFNAKFDDQITMSGIKNFGQLYNLRVDESVRNKNRRRHLDKPGSARATKNVGAIRTECGRLVMKDSNGKWKSAAKVIWEKENGPTPEGYVVTVLDGNTSNVDVSNLACVPIRYMGWMSKYNLRNDNPEVTKTGIKWCDLKDALERSMQ